MLRLFQVAIAVVLTLTAASSYAQGAAVNHLRQVIAANSLVGAGKTPFHLQMSFQYFDIQGKPGDAGVLEEWWTAPDTFLITVAIPSVNQGRPTPLDRELKIDPREEYTLGELLNTETDPVPSSYVDAVESVKEFKKLVGKNDLTCFGPAEVQPDVCVDPQNEGIRLRTELKSIVAMRNTPSIFEKTNIAFDVAIAYGGVPAASGHLQNIEIFSPSQSAIVIPEHPLDSLIKFDSRGVVHGKLLKQVDPEFPLYMPDSRGSFFPPSGTWIVLVGCRIMKDGATSHLFAIYSPDPAFTQSAIDVVKKYRFEPFLFQGKPVDVPVQVQIRFQRKQQN